MNSFGKALLLSLVVVIGCHKKSNESHFAEEKVDDIANDIQIPKNLWNLIEGKELISSEKENPHGNSGGSSHGQSSAGSAHSESKHEASSGGGEHGGGGGDGHGGGGAAVAGSEAKNILFMSVDVILREKNSGVLRSPEVKIHFPRGGGELDMVKYLGKNKGSFFVQFAWPEIAEGGEPRMFFVSRAKKRKYDDEVYGAGCKSFYEIGPGYKKELLKGGLKANSTRDLHASFLGGTYVFSHDDGKQIYLSQVTIFDSERPDLSCDK